MDVCLAVPHSISTSFDLRACSDTCLISLIRRLEFDRTWCFVDLEGTRVPKYEAISGRTIAAISTIQVSFDGDMLCLDAPGMDQLKVPTMPDAYAEAQTIRVESSGSGWWLACLDCKMHAEGSVWVSSYLNQIALDAKNPEARLGGRRLNGKSTEGKFVLVRSLHDVVDLGSYPPIFPLLEHAKNKPAYKARFEGNYRRLSDFAPFLLVSASSAREVARKCEIPEYPIQSFRGNIIVDGDHLAPWMEETWTTLNISSSSNEKVTRLALHTIKACPRCCVPCQCHDQLTGQFIFPGKRFKLLNVLKAAFPRKYEDPEWGDWAGGFMGVYMGHNGVEGTLSVGDVITASMVVPWDAHLHRQDTSQAKVVTLIGVCAAVVGVGIAFFLGN